MNEISGFKIVLLAGAFLTMTACAKSSGGAPANTSAQAQTPSSQPTAPNSDRTVADAMLIAGISDTASNDAMTIKRMDVGRYTMETINPNPKGINGSSQPGALTMAICGPRISDDNLSILANAAYPIILSENSQVIIHRDTSYQFGDGSNASSAPSYGLLVCGNQTGSKEAPLSASAGSSKVQVKHLHVSDSTMEVLNPTPKDKRISSSEGGKLILVLCAPRITDANLSQFTSSAYPILLTQGSQVALRRDTNYTFGDGTHSSSAAPEVVISCE